MVSLGTHDYWPDGGKANHSYCEQISNGKPDNLIQYYVDVVGRTFGHFNPLFLFRLLPLLLLDSLDCNNQQ